MRRTFNAAKDAANSRAKPRSHRPHMLRNHFSFPKVELQNDESDELHNFIS